MGGGRGAGRMASGRCGKRTAGPRGRDRFGIRHSAAPAVTGAGAFALLQPGTTSPLGAQHQTGPRRNPGPKLQTAPVLPGRDGWPGRAAPKADPSLQTCRARRRAASHGKAVPGLDAGHSRSNRPPARRPKATSAPAAVKIGRGRSGRRRSQTKSTSSCIGRAVMRLPVAAKIALASAGAAGGTPGSPTPLGASCEGRTCTSMAPMSPIRKGS